MYLQINNTPLLYVDSATFDSANKPVSSVLRRLLCISKPYSASDMFIKRNSHIC